MLIFFWCLILGLQFCSIYLVGLKGLQNIAQEYLFDYLEYDLGNATFLHCAKEVKGAASVNMQYSLDHAREMVCLLHGS